MKSDPHGVSGMDPSSIITQVQYQFFVHYHFLLPKLAPFHQGNGANVLGHQIYHQPFL